MYEIDMQSKLKVFVNEIPNFDVIEESVIQGFLDELIKDIDTICNIEKYDLKERI